MEHIVADKQHFSYVEKSENSEKYEYKIEDKDGDVRWFESSILPVFDGDKCVGEVRVNYDITEKKVLQHLAITDGLTGLYNRRYFNEILSREIGRAIREKSFLSFLMMDIDFFKQYNDTYGHDAGDEALIKVSKSIKDSTSRSSDFAFRLGGEEFGVVFSGSDREHSLMFAQKIREGVENLKILHANSSANKYITISVGLLVIDFSDENIDINGFYTMADDALYEAKNNGRNRVVVYENDELEFFE